MLTIEMFSLEGCQGADATMERIKTIITALHLEIEPTHTRLKTQEEIDRFNVPGSPTVRINGIDIEPAVRNHITPVMA